LMQRLVGFDARKPTVFATLSPEKKFLRFPGKGNQQMNLSDGRLVSWDRVDGMVFHRKENGAWVHVATNSELNQGKRPSLVDGDFLLWCEADGESVLVSALDLPLAISTAEESGEAIKLGDPAWRFYRVRIDEYLLSAMMTSINISEDGRLQMTFHHPGTDSYVAVVESVEKFTPRRIGDSDGK